MKYEPCNFCGEPRMCEPELRRHDLFDCAWSLRDQVRELRKEIERRDAHERAVRAATEPVHLTPHDPRVEVEDAEIVARLERARSDSQQALRAAAEATAAASRSLDASTAAVAQLALNKRRTSSVIPAAPREDGEDSEVTRRIRPPIRRDGDQ